MSTTIDQKVVEMRFDNSHFEKNVQTSMSTLDKLKRSLNLTGASKGLESINASAKNNQMGVLGGAVDQVHAKFSALQVMGVTALANITNSAVNAGKRMVSALTIDPIKTGLQEYETQINAVQTILANTSSKGTNIDQVNKALEELNKYADMTIYNFTEMTRNIGTFTAAGVDLDTSVSAIKGIANLAAVSGSTSQQASTAMYQLSQALATGTVKLQDWNSVVNAGMGGEVFQNALIRTAAAMDGAADNVEAWRAANIDSFGSFRDSLTQGAWLTTDVLTETLNQFTMAAEEGSKEWEEYKKSLMETGYTAKQAEEILKMANTATDAATKVKTFTQLWDVLKESAQSGWSQTWKLIIGDFEEAKAFLTPLADFLTGAINAMSDARNKLLEGALGKTFKGLAKTVTSITSPIQKSADSIKAVAESVKDYGKVVDEIIGGKWGNGQERFDKLAKAGYDWAHAQNLVNEKLGDSTRHATQYKEAQKEVVETQKDAEKVNAKYIAGLVELDNAKLRDLGLNNDQIRALRELEEQSKKTGIPLQEFIENIDQIDGRYLLINSFKNAGQGLVSVLTSIRDAWLDAFPPMTSNQLYDIIAGLHKFSTNLVMSEETMDKLTRTFKGLFAILGMVSDILGGGLKIAFKLLGAILGHFDLNILDVTAAIGDALVKFREATDISNLFAKALEFIVPILADAADAVKDWAKSFTKLPVVQEAIGKVKEILEDLKNLDLAAIGQDIVDGLVNGLGDGASRAVQAIVDLGIRILEGIKSVLGIHSPSTEFFEIGGNIIDGLLNGLQNGISKVLNFFKELGAKCVELMSNVDWGAVYAGLASAGIVVLLKKFVDIFEAFSSPFEGLGSIFSNTADVIEDSAKKIKKVIGGFAKVLNGFALKMKAQALLKISFALAVLAASIIALSFIEPAKLWNAVGVVAALAAVLGILAIAIDRMSQSAVSIGKDGIKLGGMKAAFVSIGLALLLLAATVKLLSGIDAKEAEQGFIRLAGCIVAMGLVFGAYSLFAKADTAKYLGKAGSMMIKMSIALGLMVGVMKLINLLSEDEIENGMKFVVAFGGFMKLWTMGLSKSGANAGKIGSMVLKITVALALMVGVVKLISLLEPSEMVKGAAFAAGFTLFVWALTAITRGKEGEGLHKIGGLLLSVSVSMLLMVGVIKLMSQLSVSDMIKGGIAIAGFTGVIYLLVKMVKTIDKDVPKVAGTLISMSIAIGIMAGIVVLMSLMSLSGIAKGLIAVGGLGAIMTMMIKATKGATDVKGSLIAMAIAIGVMAGAIAVLSLIDPKKLVGPTIALGTLMGMFALIAKASSFMTKGVMAPLIVMTVAVGVLAIIIAKLAKLPIENAIGASASLSLLLLSMSLSMALLNGIKTISAGALISLAAMTLVVGALALILVKMNEMDVQSAMTNAKAISTLLLALSGACVILGVVGLMGPASFIGIAALATLIAGIGGLIVGIGYLVDKFPVLETFLDKGIPVLDKIGSAIGSFFGNIVGGFASGVTANLPQMGSDLSSFMTNLQPFVDGAKNIDDSAMSGVSSLVKMLALISGANIIEAISSFISGQSSMETFSTNITAFGDAIVAFSKKVSGNINEESVLAAANAGKLLAEMQSAIAGTGGVFQFFTGEKNLADFGTQITAFGNAIVAFSRIVAGNVNEEAVTAAVNVGNMLAEMQAKIVPSGGVIQWFCGERDMETFGQQLVAFGRALVSFSRKVAGSIDEEAVKAAANAGTLMSEMQSKIVPTGGVVQWFCGEKDMATFGTQLVAFGTAIVAFSHKVSEGVDEKAVQAAATAGMIMTEMQSKIVPTGGVVAWFCGEKDMATFGTQLVSFGKSIASFSKEVSGNIDEGAITAAANAGKIMVTLQKSIPADKWLDGKVSLDDFGSTIKKFGGHIKSYSEKVSGIDEEAIRISVSATRNLVSITKSLGSVKPENIDNFKAKTLGEAIKGYSDKVSGINISKVTNSITAMTKIRNFINSLSGFSSSGVESFKSAVASLANIKLNDIVNNLSTSSTKLTSIGSNMVDSIAKGMNSRQGAVTQATNNVINAISKRLTSSLSSFQKPGADIMLRIVAGIKSKNSSVASAIKSPLSSGVTAIRGYYTNFYNAGSYLVTGFANGISSNSYKATAKAKAMAKAAKEAAEKALGIQSPSRVFYAIGEYVVKGFTNALGNGERSAGMAASDMAESARLGFTKAISSITELLDGEIDASPVISPVLDLDDIRSGAGMINRMFNMQPSVGVAANLSSVNSLMNSRVQNGNYEVVSAIDKLRKDLGNVGNTTYTFGDITYDGNNAVTEAVETLVRAVKMGRRV